eukprot:6506014-Prymnesium_polylepis.1
MAVVRAAVTPRLDVASQHFSRPLSGRVARAQVQARRAGVQRARQGPGAAAFLGAGALASYEEQDA